jgi:hypothetical protein
MKIQVIPTMDFPHDLKWANCLYDSENLLVEPIDWSIGMGKLNDRAISQDLSSPFHDKEIKSTHNQRLYI